MLSQISKQNGTAKARIEDESGQTILKLEIIGFLTKIRV
jgi:hypothetical protein